MKTCEDIFDQAKVVKFQELNLFPDDYVNSIVNGNCVHVLSSIPDNSIQLIVTSPPYFVNKSYETEWTLEKYSNLMDRVFEEVNRVLQPGRYLVINFGDYFNKDRFYTAEIPSIYPASINFFNWGIKHKFDLQATRIWRKQFTRMSIPFVCNSHPRPVFDYEHIWSFRKRDGSNKEFVNDRKLSQRAVLGEGWKAPAKIGEHEAAFPIDLPIWAIDVYSKSEQDIVLDPFFGIGTTGLAAIARNRKWVGIELDEEHCKKAFQRIKQPFSAT